MWCDIETVYVYAFVSGSIVLRIPDVRMDTAMHVCVDANACLIYFEYVYMA